MSDPKGDERLRTRLLAAIAAILAVAALKLTSPVTMPLAFALFVIILAWPLQHRLEGLMPRPAAFALTVGALAAVLGAFVGALAYSADQVAAKAPQYGARLQTLADRALGWAEARGLPVPENPAAELGAGALDTFRTLAFGTFEVMGLAVVIAALVLLGLLEVKDTHRRLEARFSGTVNARLFHVADAVTRQFRRFVGARTITSGLTGVLTGLYCWIAGLDFAFAWGLSAYLLNYIPTLGSVVSVGAITLFAALQFQSVGWALLTLAVLTGIQITLGSFVDPKLQGRYLSISPFVVLFSIVFWGWLWGIPGALLAVPLTVTIIVAASEFDRARWVADLLTEADEEEA